MISTRSGDKGGRAKVSDLLRVQDKLQTKILEKLNYYKKRGVHGLVMMRRMI